MADVVRAITHAQIPVMGHIGLTPQSVNVFGGFKVQGKEEARARALIEDALTLEEAGAFSIVLEAVPEELARIITEKLTIPTIGIGAGRWCDGQILVINDILGMYSDFTPKFVRRYANLKDTIAQAVAQYGSDVRAQRFPAKENTFAMDATVVENLRTDDAEKRAAI